MMAATSSGFTATGTKPGCACQHHLQHVRQTLVGRIQAWRVAPARAGNGFLGYGEAALVDEEQGCAAVVEQFSDLVSGKGGVEGTAVLPLAMIPR